MYLQFWIRSRDVTDNEARKEGLLAGLYSETFGEPVEPNPQAVFKRPAEYVATVIITVYIHSFTFTVWIDSDYYSFTFTVLDYSLHSQFYIHSDYSDYSDYYSDCLH